MNVVESDICFVWVIFPTLTINSPVAPESRIISISAGLLKAVSFTLIVMSGVDFINLKLTPALRPINEPNSEPPLMPVNVK